MFGCIAAGRPVDTNTQQVDVNKFACQILDATTVNHIVVFLLGTVPFEPGFGASVHFLWPGKEWKLLGMLSNEKPSAIFRLQSNNGNDTRRSESGLAENTHMSVDDLSSTSGQASSPVAVTIGFSLEPLPLIQSQLATMQQEQRQQNPGQREVSMSGDNLYSGGGSISSTSSSALVPVSSGFTIKDPTAVALRVLENFYNYVTGFAVTGIPPGTTQILAPPPMQINPGAVVPVKIFLEWYTKLCTKIKGDPGILFKDT